jgi:outer membrane protein TolC
MVQGSVLVLAAMTPHWLVGCVVALVVTISGAGASAQERERMPLSIQDAVRLALTLNLDLEIERVNPPIAYEQIREAAGQFDPLLGASTTYSRQKRFPNSQLEQTAVGGLVRDTIFTPNTSLTGKLTPGTQYNLSLIAPVTKTDNPQRLFDHSYTPVLTFGLTQPLLRDFGTEVNLVKFRQAEKSERQAIFGVEAKMLSVIQNVETQYWTVFYSQQHVNVAQGNLELAEDLVQRVTRQKDAGLATALDVLQAKSAVEARRGDLARARADLLNAQAQLRLLVNPKLGITKQIVTSERPPEEGPPSDLQRKLARAMARRPEIPAQELVIEKLTLEELLAKNNTLWRLDAIGSTGYNGLAGTGVGPSIRGLPPRLQGQDSFFDAFRDFLTPQGAFSWSIGMQLQIPIGNQQALGKLNETRLQKRQEELRLSLLKSQISVQVETAFEDLAAGWAQLGGVREAVSLAREQLAAQEKQLAAGLTTVRKVLEAQDNLATTQDKENQALVNYASAQSRLDAAEAASFDTYRLVLQR